MGNKKIGLKIIVGQFLDSSHVSGYRAGFRGISQGIKLNSGVS